MSADKPKDPITEKLRQAKEERKAQADLAEGERDLGNQFQRQADKDAPEELAKIESLFLARCQEINAAKDGDDPEFSYNLSTHELRAGNKFATRLELFEGYSPYRLNMVSGLRSDAAQVFAPGMEPEYEPASWKLFAHMDDTGFFWESNGERLSSEQMVEEGLNALTDNLARGG